MSILIVSDHNLVRQSFAAMLQSLSSAEFREVSHCEIGNAMERIHERKPDLVIVEGIVDPASAVTTISMLARTKPDTRLAALGRQTSDAVVFDAIRAGADGYLSCEVSLETLSAALRGVMRGELGLTRVEALGVVQQLREMTTAYPSEKSLASQYRFTRRELEIFELLRSGLRSRDIATQLCIAEATVYKHIQHILGKLQVRSRAQAILLAESDIEPNPLAGVRDLSLHP